MSPSSRFRRQARRRARQRQHRQPLDADVEDRPVRCVGTTTMTFDGRERGQHGRADELQVLERPAWQPVEARRSSPSARDG